MPKDPYGRDNPLGPRNILSAYTQTFTAVETGRADSLLVATQETLDLTHIDAGLAVTVASQQRALKRQSHNFAELVEPDYIALVSALDNLLGLLDAVDTTYRRPMADPVKQWDDVTQMLSAIAQSAGENVSAADGSIDHLDVMNEEITRISKKLDTTLKAARESLDVEAKKSLGRVEALTKKIHENLQAIVDGAHSTGDAFTEFGIGLLTTISQVVTPGGKKDGKDGAAKDNDKKDGKDNDKKDDGKQPGTAPNNSDRAGESASAKQSPSLDDTSGKDLQATATKNPDGAAPDVSFVISAIKAGSKGTEKYATALKDLQTNNDLLAAEYQRVAATDRLLAIASAAQSQKDLYAAAIRDTQAATTRIRDAWETVHEAYSLWAAKTDQADRDEFARLHEGAMTQWKKLAAEVTRIKRHLVTVDTNRG